MTIIPLREGNYSVDQRKHFTPIANPTDPATGLKMAINPFLIKIGNDQLLLDTGLPDDQPGNPGITECLRRENTTPEQITHVFLSHLHKDHLDGIGTFVAEDELVPRFPHAKVYLQQREYDYALTQTDNPSYRPAMLRLLPTLPNLVWLNDNEGNITDQLSYLVTGGHSPFHQVCWIREEAQTVFYGADNLPQKSYLKPGLAYKSDYDGSKARQWRQQWIKTAKEENWVILLYHDLTTPAITL
ncbi:MBL fold metallo-hydrolase [Paraflavitalea pollutisoli]|uniref:MBL fold metallo-hydrolase n=1 Tax=Paraflavitalea pollutisoli TaxID=3034143 RepID=UPI0023EBDFF1|nr:MBL fold metallo-hydrolase [Paraflavitalea sp. H1-2-19X]